jgi:hypothetical protein
MNIFKRVSRVSICCLFLFISFLSVSVMAEQLNKRQSAYIKLASDTFTRLDQTIKQLESGAITVGDIYKKSGLFDKGAIWDGEDIATNFYELKEMADTYPSDLSLLIKGNEQVVSLASITALFTQYEPLPMQGKVNLPLEKKQKAQQVSRFIALAMSNEIAKKLNELGYKDAMLSFGKFGNPANSTYAVLHCFSQGNDTSEFNVKEKDNVLSVSFGKKMDDIFFIPKETIKLSLAQHYVEQYIIVDYVVHKSKKVLTAFAKLGAIYQRIKSCEKQFKIKLII